MWTDWRYAPRVRGEALSRASGSVRGNRRAWLPLLVALLPLPAASAEDVAVRLRDDGRLDVRANAASVTAVLERLAQTGMKLTYEGPPPCRTVTLAVSGADHAQAVLEVLDDLGVDYVVTLNPTGTRILTAIVAETPRRPRAQQKAEAPLPADSESDVPPAPPEVTQQAADSGADASSDPTAGFPLLPGDFVPGGRATGQTTEWGMPPFVLPDPPTAPPPAPKATPVP